MIRVESSRNELGMIANNPKLHVVMYHYVRDLPRTRFPRIKGMTLNEFRTQIAWLASHYEMTSLHRALEFLRGDYTPAGDLCVLTFDDGLKEHYTDVMPILAEYSIQGIFGVITSCIENHIIAPVHMNHFLMAELDFDTYRSVFIRRLEEMKPGALTFAYVDPQVAQQSYPLDTREVATFKFLFNFSLNPCVRDAIVKSIFDEYFGDQESFACELYMSWEEVREVQNAGMLVAGHTHWHRPLSTLTDAELDTDLSTSRALLDQNLAPQDLWPFSYPYGKKNSYTEAVVRLLPRLGFTCAFNTECGANSTGAHVFELNRVDCNGAIQQQLGC